MTIAQFIVAYAMAWWLIFFMVLPFGTTPEEEQNGMNYAAAPKQTNLKRKYWITTGITTALMAFFWWVIEYSEWDIF